VRHEGAGMELSSFTQENSIHVVLVAAREITSSKLVAAQVERQMWRKGFALDYTTHKIDMRNQCQL
jgi:2'-5' RNA ligase